MKIKKIITAGLLISVFLGILAFFQSKNLPDSSSILPEILNNPIQEKIENPQKFEVSYQEIDYEIEPLYSYELWGLVVSHNDISSLSDMYHDKKSFDTKDLCVIWGENIKTNGYQKMEFESGSWTCYFTYPSVVSFSSSQLSNNHLITNSKEVRNKIEEVSIGDQIFIQGNLVNYSKKETSWERKTSITREDQGNHACEVIFVENIEILKKMSPQWRFWFEFSKWIFIIFLLLRVGVWFYETEQQRKNF